jgi:hypothetical protein
MTMIAAYKLIVYAPRAEDPTESTPLVPIAGAPHSDPFQVASVAGPAGFKPYLYAPRGRTGEIKLLSRMTDAGEMTFSLADGDLVSGSDAERFVTAYMGDAYGQNRINGCMVRVWESLDFDPAAPGAATWVPYWTGRVQQPALNGRLTMDLTVRDAAAGLNHELFTGAPHSSIAYARPANVLPTGYVGAYGPVTPTAPLTGKVKTLGYAESYEGAVFLDGLEGQDWATATIQALDGEPYRPADDAGLRASAHPSARAYVKRLDTGAAGWFRLAKIRGSTRRSTGERRYFDWWFDAPANPQAVFSHFRVRGFGIQELMPSEVGYMARPPADTAVEVYVIPGAKRGQAAPLLIDAVHPVQLIADAAAAKFARLKSDGSVFPHYVMPVNAANFAALLADQSFTPIRLPITEPERARDFISDVCMWSGLGWRVNGGGELELVDLRLPSALPVAPTIGPGDYDRSTPPQWAIPSADQVTRAEFVYYIDTLLTAAEVARTRAEFPDIPPGMVRSEPVDYTPIDLAEEVINQERKALTVDARGLRAFVTFGVGGSGASTVEDVRRYLDRMDAEMRGAYAYGPRITTVTCARTANTSGCNAGDVRFLNIPELPNPDTNRRGGLTLARCLSRLDDGIRLELKFIAIPNAIAIAPTLGALTSTTDGANGTVSVPVTLNAAGEPAEVDIAVTATSVAVRPAATAAEWQRGRVAPATGTLAIQDLPIGRRVWLRARSNPLARAGGAPKYPSAYVYPTGAGYIDIVASPRLLTVRALVDDATGTVDVPWTPVDSGVAAVRIYWGVGPDNGPASPPAHAYEFDTASTTPTIPGLVVERGQRVSVEVKPYPGWTGSAVSGTPGTSLLDNAARANAPDPSIPAPTLVVTLDSQSDTAEVWRIQAAVAAGASLPMLWRVASYDASLPPTAYTTDADGVVDTTVSLARLPTRQNAFQASAVDGDGRVTNEPIYVSAQLPAVDPPTGRINPVTPLAGTTRTLTGIDTDALLGKAADTDLTAFNAAGTLDRAGRHVLLIRDQARGVGVSGAQAATGARLVDPADTAVRLPPTEVSAGDLPGAVNLTDAVRGVAVSGAQAATGARLVDTADTAVRLPPTEVATGALNNDVGASDGATQKAIPKGMAGPFQAYNGVTFTFSPAYQDTPPIFTEGTGAVMEERAKWGTLAQVDAGTASSAKPTNCLFRFVDLGTRSGAAYAPRFYIMAKQAPVAKSAAFAAPTSVSAIGATTGNAQPAAGDVPSADGKFRAAVSVSISNGGAGAAGGTVVVALLLSIDGGPPTEVGTGTVGYYVPGGGGLPTVYPVTIEAPAAAVAGGNDTFAVQLKSKTGGATAVAVGVTTLTWSYDPGALYASATPGGADDSIPIYVMARS